MGAQKGFVEEGESDSNSFFVFEFGVSLRKKKQQQHGDDRRRGE